MNPGIQLAPGCIIPARYLTRHVGVFGATGTGKTTTDPTQKAIVAYLES